MRTHEFTLVLSGISEMTDDIANAMYEAGCDDGSCASRDGTAFVMFDRDANSLRKAVESAIADVAKAGFRVARVETDDSNLIAEINAELSGATAST